MPPPIKHTFGQLTWGQEPPAGLLWSPNCGELRAPLTPILQQRKPRLVRLNYLCEVTQLVRGDSPEPDEASTGLGWLPDLQALLNRGSASFPHPQASPRPQTRHRCTTREGVEAVAPLVTLPGCQFANTPFAACSCCRRLPTDLMIILQIMIGPVF